MARRRAAPRLTKKDLVTLDALRVGDPFDQTVAERLIRRGFAYYIGGEISISPDGREMLARYGEVRDNPRERQKVCIHGAKITRCVRPRSPRHRATLVRETAAREGWAYATTRRAGKRFVTDSIGGPAVGSEHLDLDVYEDERGDNPRMRDSKKRLAFSVLNNTFGSPENQKRGWASEEQAANSAATLLAPRIGVSYSTALSVVREWYAGHRNNPQPWAKVFG